jgi:hypothetical protein
MKDKKVDYETLFHLADKTIKELLELFDGSVTLSPKELYELSQIMGRYNNESIKIIHKEDFNE